MKTKLIGFISMLFNIPFVFAHEAEGMMDYYDSMWWFLWTNPMTIIALILIIILIILIIWLMKNE